MRPRRLQIPAFLRRLGARGFLMLVCAYIWFWLGAGNYEDILTTRPFVILFDIAPHVRGIMWWAGALVAVFTAGSRGRANYVGLGCLAAMPLFVVTTYAQALIAAHVPGGSPGYADAWFQAAVFGALPLLVLAAALIPQPPNRIVSAPHDPGTGL